MGAAQGSLPRVTEPKSDLLSLFDPDPGRALRRYRVLETYLLRFFEWNGCLDPEDLTQEVFKRMIERVNEGAEIYSEPSGYAYGIAKRILKEQPKKRRTN